jgi:AcrR family transcriptional regulator
LRVLVEGSTLQREKLPLATASHIARRKRPSLAAKRKRRSADDVMNRLIRAAAEEFKRCGFAGTTTAGIARKAEVTEAQLFRYFGSKSNLFRETIFKPIEQHLRTFINEHVQDFGEVATARERTSRYTTELQRFISKHSQMLTSLVVAQTYESGNAHGVSEIDSLATYFDRGASLMRQRLKGTATVDPKLLVRVTFASVLGCIMFKNWVFPPGLAGDEEITTAINNFIMDGLSSNSTRD